MPDKSNDSKVDPAALAAAVFGAAITTLGPPGPFTLQTFIIGATLLIIVCSYEFRRYRESNWQNLAFGAVCALILLLIYGFIREAWEAGSINTDSKENVFIVEDVKGEKAVISRINNVELGIVWLISTLLFTFTGWLGSEKAGEHPLKKVLKKC